MIDIFAKLLPSNEAGAETSVFLIVGLGNPGRDYKETRHNIGFMAVDRLCQAQGIMVNKVQSKALVGQGRIDAQKVIVAKPQTYMNLSGQAVSSIARFYKVPPSHLMVIHDDLDLPLGTLRIRPGGGAGGQKGVRSIIEQLGTPEFARMRIGIGRPPGHMDAADYVLQTFSKAEQDVLITVFDRVVQASTVFVREGLEKAMNLYNGVVEKG